jgi:hypothetical protein
MLARCTMVHNFFGRAVASTSMATPQFEFVPQTLCIGNHMRGLVLGKVFAVWSRVVANRSYRPERHYMRGPGPKTLAMIGRRYRSETAEATREPLPEHWLALIHSIDEHEKKRSGDDQANAR